MRARPAAQRSKQWASPRPPEQATFLFEGLDLSDPAEAVVTISFFLDRIDQLESGIQTNTAPCWPLGGVQVRSQPSVCSPATRGLPRVEYGTRCLRPRLSD